MLQYYELNVLTWALPSIGVECIIRVNLYIYLNYSIDKFSTIDIVIIPGLQNPLISVTKDEEDSVDVLYKFATDKKFSFNLRQARPQLLCLHSLQKTPTWYSKLCSRLIAASTVKCAGNLPALLHNWRNPFFVLPPIFLKYRTIQYNPSAPLASLLLDKWLELETLV